MDHASTGNTEELGPQAIRETIARTREELGEHLTELKERFLSPQRAEGPETKDPMPAKKATRSKASGQGSTARSNQDMAKSSGNKNPNTAKDKTKKTTVGKRTTSRKKSGMMSKAGEVLDTMLAGAVTGAVTGAARELSEGQGGKQGGGTSKKGSETTSKVIGEMAPGAAIGAVVGAAKAVVPSEGGKEKSMGGSRSRAKSTKASKGR
jgi:hypothetical protein